MPTFQQKDKNHITYLQYEAILKQEQQDIKKQVQKETQKRIRSKYGW